VEPDWWVWRAGLLPPWREEEVMREAQDMP